MSSLSTLPKGDSAWLLRKAVERIMQQVSVLETNIGSSTTGNSANTQIIFNDAGTLRGDPDLTFSTALNKLVVNNIETAAGLLVGTNATITGDLTVDTSTLKVDSANNRVGIGTASPGYPLHVSATDAEIVIQDSNTAVGSNPASLLSFWGSASRAGYIGYPSDNNLYITQVANSSILFLTNNTTQMTLNATGLLVGTTSAGGSISNASYVLGGIFSTLNGILPSVVTATPTTIFAAPSESTLIVTAYVPGASPSDYKVVAVVKRGGAAVAITTISSATNVTITSSGTDIQATQTSGGTQNIYFNVLRLA